MPAVHRGRGRPLSQDDSRSDRVVIVSNRAPLEHIRNASGEVVRRPTDGGVATALSAMADNLDIDWIACAATEEDVRMARSGQRVKLGAGSRLAYAAPPAGAYDLFYNTFCNPMLWFLHHGIWDGLQVANPGLKAQHAWQLGYVPVNQSIAEMVAAALRGRKGRVMFHDYHLYTAPLIVRNYHPEASLQHFIHVPWPDPAAWMALPRKIPEAICRGLLANNSVVFQTEDSVDNFLATCDDLLPEVRVNFRDAIVGTPERAVRVWANPISVDPADLHQRLLSPEAQAMAESLRPTAGEKTILRVDRLDPAKNVLAGFEAYERLSRASPGVARQGPFSCLPGAFAHQHPRVRLLHRPRPRGGRPHQ